MRICYLKYWSCFVFVPPPIRHDYLCSAKYEVEVKVMNVEKPKSVDINPF